MECWERSSPGSRQPTTLRSHGSGSLEHSRDRHARRRGKELRPPPPPERKPNAIGYTHDEATHANLDELFKGTLEHMRTVAERLRGKLADDYGA